MTTENTAADTPQAQGTAAPVNSAGNASDNATSTAQEGAEHEDDGSGEGEGQPKKSAQDDDRKKQSRYDRKIGKLTGENHYLKRQLAELQSKVDAVDKRTAPKPAPRPKAEDFKTAEEYDDALFDWRMANRDLAKNNSDDRGGKQEQAQERKNPGNMTAAENRARFEAAEKIFAEKNADYDDVMEDFSDALPEDRHGGTVANACLSHPKGPALIYHLGKNPDVLDQVLSLHPARIPAKLDRIAESLKEAPAKQQQQLPNPPNPLKGGGSSRPESEMSGRELRKKAGLI